MSTHRNSAAEQAQQTRQTELDAKRQQRDEKIAAAMAAHPAGKKRAQPAQPAPDADNYYYPASYDRIYPRCPVCRTEQYGPSVLGFSRGEHGCHRCGHVIREDARHGVRP